MVVSLHQVKSSSNLCQLFRTKLIQKKKGVSPPWDTERKSWVVVTWLKNFAHYQGSEDVELKDVDNNEDESRNKKQAIGQFTLVSQLRQKGSGNARCPGR